MSLLICCALLNFAPTLQDSKDAKDELILAEQARHQGTWVTVAFEHEGQSTPQDVASTITRQVTGDHVVWKRSGKSFSGSTVTYDPTTSPKRITVTPDSGNARDKPVKGIYKLEGDKLTICMAEPGKEPPKEFAATKENHNTLMTLRRVPTPPTTPRRPRTP